MNPKNLNYLPKRRPMKCGNCDCSHFSLRFGKGQTLYARCRKCRSETAITVMVKMVVDFDRSKGEGTIC